MCTQKLALFVSGLWNMSRIKEWPLGERPRERLLKSGSGALSDAQLLAILLRTGSGGENVLQLAMQLSKKYSPLSRMTKVSISELCSVKGIGPAKAVLLKAAFELGRRSLASPFSEGTALLDSRTVYEHFAPLLQGASKEYFKIVLLNQKNRVIYDETVSEGSLTSTVVHPREAFGPAVRESAASVIFVHNHPSGDPTPSRQDKQITERLVAAGDLMGIPVLDHIIVGNGTYFSFADAGDIKNQNVAGVFSENAGTGYRRRSLK